MTDTLGPMAVLTHSGSTLTRTMAAIRALEPALPAERHLAIGLASNVSIDLLATFLRKQGVLHGCRVEVQVGSHDDDVANAARFAAAGLQAMVLLPFFDNLLPAFELQIPLMTPAQIDAKVDDLRARWRLVFESTRGMRHVLVGTLHRMGEPVDTGRPDAVSLVLQRLNGVLREEAAAHAQVRLVDTEAIVGQLGAAACFDPRFYLRSTAPYTTAFLDALAQRLALATRGFGSHFHKALVLDCDNTLWGGVVGEDGLQGLKLDPHSHPGRVFWRAQLAFQALEQQGVLLCLCSKNNAADVDEVLAHHPSHPLRPAHFAAVRVNWDDKVANLRSIAAELNIGLDSLVFVDDSAYECEAVRSALPMVRVFQVPEALTDYPRLLHEIQSLFLGGGTAADGASKTEQYRQRRAALDASQQFDSHEAYLASLALQVRIARDDPAQAPRVSELSLKSNQFNLTTLRLTTAEVQQRMQAADRTVYSLSVGDRFGEAGLTGVLVAHWQGEVATIDAFLMSCRVIGRGIEFAVWPTVLADARRQGCRFIEAEYRPTAKNAQVADFYDRLGLPCVAQQDGVRRYRVAVASFQPRTIDWIQVKP